MNKRVVGLAALLVVVAGCSSSNGAVTAGTTAPDSTAPPGSPSIIVTSTLDGRAALPHRIRWYATPTPPGQVSEIDFLVDGRQLWVERIPPYDYGEDGNYLVTSFLTPGSHQFTVRAIGLEGQIATDAVTATVPAAPAPPTALAGTWRAWLAPAKAYASLIITAEGWYEGDFPVTHTSGNREDVAYLAPGLVEVRTGMATGHDLHDGASFDDDLNGWCDDAPGSPARYRWSIRGTKLHLTFVSGNPCAGFTKFLSAPWSRVP